MIALRRKNALFAGSDGEHWAVIGPPALLLAGGLAILLTWDDAA